MPKDVDSASDKTTSDDKNTADSNDTVSLIQQMTEFVKLIYVEQRLPALILTLVLSASGAIAIARSSDDESQFLWIAIALIALFVTCFVLPRQSKQFQSVKAQNVSLKNENEELISQCSAYTQKIDQIRAQISDRTKQSLAHLEKIELGLGDMRSQVREFLSPNADKSDEEIGKLDIEILQLLEYIEKKKQEIGGLQERIDGAQNIFDSAPDVAKLFANYSDETDNPSASSK